MLRSRKVWISQMRGFRLPEIPRLRFVSIRRQIAERLANKFDEGRVAEVGPDLACLEWLMWCGATEVKLSDGTSIRRISEMKEYVRTALELRDSDKALGVRSPSNFLLASYLKQWPNAPPVYITDVDASDSAIADPGFPYFRHVFALKSLKLNFCDYFGDDAMRELSLGRPASSLELVLNPAVSDGAVYWLCRMKVLRRAHFYFLPYVSNRAGFIRQLRIALPKCEISFPESEYFGLGY